MQGTGLHQKKGKEKMAGPGVCTKEKGAREPPVSARISRRRKKDSSRKLKRGKHGLLKPKGTGQFRYYQGKKEIKDCKHSVDLGRPKKKKGKEPC